MATYQGFGQVAKEKQLQLVAKAVLGGQVRNVSNFAIKGATTVDFPKLAAGQAYIVGLTDAITASNADYSSDQLSFQKLGYLFQVNVNVDKQNLFNATEDSFKNGIEAMARAVDGDIYGKIKTVLLADANLQHTATASIYDDVISMNKIQDDNQTPGTDRSLIVNNADYAKLLRSKEFTRFDSVGKDRVSTGLIGEVLGNTVVRMTDSTVCTHSMVIHRSIAAWAIQGEMSTLDLAAPSTGLVTISMQDNYGSKVLQGGKTGCILMPAAE